MNIILDIHKTNNLIQIDVALLELVDTKVFQSSRDFSTAIKRREWILHICSTPSLNSYVVFALIHINLSRDLLCLTATVMENRIQSSCNGTKNREKELREKLARAATKTRKMGTKFLTFYVGSLNIPFSSN